MDTDIAQLQATFDTVMAELRQSLEQQAATRPGTTEWWTKQQEVGDLRQRKNEAELALLEAQLATVAADSTKAQGWGNRLHLLRQEMAANVAKPVQQRGAALWYGPLHPRGGRGFPDG